MSKKSPLVAAIAFALLVAAPASLPAREQIPAETRETSYAANLSACESESVLGTIRARFSRTEGRFWQSQAEIVAIDRVRQAAFRPHGLDLIPRRYCEAVATMHDRRQLKLRYAIIEGAGFGGLGEGVQYCLDGYDRNHTAMPGCYRLDR